MLKPLSATPLTLLLGQIWGYVILKFKITRKLSIASIEPNKFFQQTITI